MNVCPAVALCFGKGRLPKHISDEYSLTDGIHPWGSRGVSFLGALLYSWWRRYEEIVSDELHTYTAKTGLAAMQLKEANFNQTNTNSNEINTNFLPVAMYPDKAIGICTRCEAMTSDSDAKLKPLGHIKGFKIVTRMKVGYGGFNPNDTTLGTKSFKKSWQAEKAGSSISFKFYGSSVKVAIWQRRDGMGVLNAVVDGDDNNVAKASGFFKGYTWAMERNNTGRSEIMSLFEGLEDREHIIKFTVAPEPANVWVKGHTTQIFALLSASDNKNCKTVLLI